MTRKFENDILELMENIVITENILLALFVIAVLYYIIKILVKRGFSKSKFYSIFFKDISISAKNDLTDIQLHFVLVVFLGIVGNIYHIYKVIQVDDYDKELFIYALFCSFAIACVLLGCLIYNCVMHFQKKYIDKCFYDKFSVIIYTLCIVLALLSITFCERTSLYLDFIEVS